MDTTLLQKIGLNNGQAKAYLALTQYGSMPANELSQKINESRTNTYKILETLEQIDLVTKADQNKKLHFKANNPTKLEDLALKKRNQVLKHEQEIKNAMPALLNFFYTYSEQPGVRFFQGKDGLKHIFDDMLRTRQDIYLVRSTHDVSFYDNNFYKEFQKKRAKLGIKTHALTPDVSSANHDPEKDKSNLFERTWMPKNDYTGASEWNVYGSKLAIISYGEEGIGMIIESPIVADSFRQLFGIMKSAYCD